MDPRLDRIPEFDPKSRQFPIREITPDKPKPYSWSWRCKALLDQGSEGACTGFATVHEAIAYPAPWLDLTEADAKEIYYRARQLDDYPGEDYSGSSVLGAVKAGMEKGWYVEYRWAFSEEDLLLAVSHEGPAILGVNWYADMHDPDDKGFITVGGEQTGGHAILCRGVSLKRDAYLLHNSWGKDWGKNGECWISRPDMVRLLAESGEACIPIVRGKQPGQIVQGESES